MRHLIQPRGNVQKEAVRQNGITGARPLKKFKHDRKPYEGIVMAFTYDQ